ncbi:MAG: hypothetical protein KJP02_12400 [Octadecabacter sp.]|nr:hypothetical protein [Octadecabacter sp.]
MAAFLFLAAPAFLQDIVSDGLGRYRIPSGCHLVPDFPAGCGSSHDYRRIGGLFAHEEGNHETCAAIAKDTPPSERYGAIPDVPNRELQAIWLTDKPVETALKDTEYEVQDLLDR